MTGWAEALDTYEASLRHHQELVDTGAADGENPWPPADLPTGLVPTEFADRAAELIARSDRIVDAMAAKMANIPARKPTRYPHQATRNHSRWSTSL